MSGHAHGEARSDADVIRAVLDRVWCGDKVIGIEIIGARDALARLTVDTPGQPPEQATSEDMGDAGGVQVEASEPSGDSAGARHQREAEYQSRIVSDVQAVLRSWSATRSETEQALREVARLVGFYLATPAGVSGGTPPAERHTGFGDCACDDCWPPDETDLGGDGGPVAVDTAASHYGRTETFPPYVGGDDDEIDEWQAQCQCGYRGRKWTHSVGALSDLVDHLNGVVRGTPTGSARLPSPEETPSAYQRGYDNALALHGRAMEATERARMAAVARAEAAERERERDENERMGNEWGEESLANLRRAQKAERRVGLLEEALRAADTALVATQLPCDCESDNDCYCQQYPTDTQIQKARAVIAAALAGVETGPGKEHGNTGGTATPLPGEGSGGEA